MAYQALMVAATVAFLAAPASAAPSRAKQAVAPKEKICIQYSSDTGSRIARIDCKTKSDWAKAGVYLDDLNKK